MALKDIVWQVARLMQDSYRGCLLGRILHIPLLRTDPVSRILSSFVSVTDNMSSEVHELITAFNLSYIPDFGYNETQNID